MKLSSAIDNDVALKPSWGAVFSVDARILRSFHRPRRHLTRSHRA